MLVCDVQELCVRLQLEFRFLVHHAYTVSPASTAGSAVLVKVKHAVANNRKATIRAPTVELTRDTQAPGPCTLPYWGRIVDDPIGSNLPKETTMPLSGRVVSGPAVCTDADADDDSEQYAPLLHIDGRGLGNPERSNFCAAWLVQRVSLPAKDAEKIEDDNAAEPVAKKRKSAKPKAVAQPTHQVSYRPIRVSMTMQGQTEETVFEYQRPVLEDY